jgi:hypothetical protein
LYRQVQGKETLAFTNHKDRRRRLCKYKYKKVDTSFVQTGTKTGDTGFVQSSTKTGDTGFAQTSTKTGDTSLAHQIKRQVAQALY